MDVKTDQGESKDTSIDKPAESIQTTPISAEQYQALMKTVDDQKKEISGLNRKNTDYEKALQQKELEKLSELEKEKALTEIARKERLAEQEKSANLIRERAIDKALVDAGIPLEFAKRISGQEESEIQADVKAFKDYIDKLVNNLKEEAVNKALAGKAPVSGSAPTGKTITEAQFFAMNPRDHAAFFASGGKIEG